LLINALDEDDESALSVAAKRIGGPAAVRQDLGTARDRRHPGQLLEERAFEFPVERAAFVPALHRLFVSGSDRDSTPHETGVSPQQ